MADDSPILEKHEGIGNALRSYDQLNKLVKSLQEFPEMLEARPIVIDKDGTVLGEKSWIADRIRHNVIFQTLETLWLHDRFYSGN